MKPAMNENSYALAVDTERIPHRFSDGPKGQTKETKEYKKGSTDVIMRIAIWLALEL
jgi:hypothetical protein